MKSFFKLLFLILLCLNQVKAEDNYSSGYYISVNNDTIEGLIYIKNFTLKNQSILFKSTENTASTQLNPQIVNSIVIPEKRRFISLQYKSDFGYRNNYFFEVIIDANTSLLFLPQANDSFLFLLDSDSLYYLSHESKLVKIGNKTFEFNYEFRRILRYLLKDCPEMEDKIRNVRYDLKPMSRLITDYNNCKSTNSTIINEKELNGKIALGLTTGGNYSTLSFPIGSEDLNYKSTFYPSIGFKMTFSSDKFAPRASLSLEAHASSFRYELVNSNGSQTNQINNFQFPIILSYKLLNKKTDISIEFGASTTKMINKPIRYCNIDSLELRMNGVVDIIAGVKYGIDLKNRTMLEAYARYMHGENIMSPFLILGKRNRISIGLTYYFWKNR